MLYDLARLPLLRHLEPLLTLRLLTGPRGGVPLSRQQDAQLLHNSGSGTLLRSQLSGKFVDQWLTTHGSKAKDAS